MNPKFLKRRPYGLIAACLLLAGLPLDSTAEAPRSTEDLLRAVAEHRERTRVGVDNFKVVRVAQGIGPPGQEIVDYYERDEVTGEWSKLHPAEIAQREAELQTNMARKELADSLKEFAEASTLVGLAFEAEFQSRLASAGMGAIGGRLLGMMSSSFLTFGPENSADGATCKVAKTVNDMKYGDDAGNPTLNVEAAYQFVNPLALMMESSCIYSVAAQVLETDYDRQPETMMIRQDMLQQLVNHIEFGGRVDSDRGPAYELSLDNLDLRDSSDGYTMHIHTVHRYFNPEHFGDMGMKMLGTLEHRGEVRDIWMERRFDDFKAVPGSDMIEPYRESFVMGGMMSAEQQAEMKQAATQVADMRRQLAAMPPDQRAMVRRMMGGQLESMERMANSGTFEFATITKRIMVNTDVTTPSDFYDPEKPEALTQEIQYSLKTLGYDPGNFDGNLSKSTIAAIISFQRDYEMELTGKPTPALARILSAAISALPTTGKQQ